MKTIFDLFIPYELALIAKKKGFVTSNYFKVYDTLGYLQNEVKMNELDLPFIQAPTHQQIVDWFREKREIEISYPVIKQKDLGTFYGGYLKKFEWEFGKSYGSNFTTYYEALNKAIEEAFKLI